MKALVFGCGYLGKRVAIAWLQNGHDVFAMTRSAQNAQSFAELGIQPLIGDVCEPKTLENLPSVDTVLHAVGFDRNSGKNREEVVRDGMSNVLSVMRDRCKCFIQISSTSVYGQSDGQWVNEDSDCQPTQEGGLLCLAAESLVREEFPANSDVKASILRLAGIYGVGRLLSRIDSLRNGVPLVGRGDSWLNLIHVEDAVTAVLRCAEEDAAGTTYNVVDDRPIRRLDYFGKLAQLIGAPDPTFDASQPGARGSGGLNKRCSNQKLRQNLGWAPKFASIETGLPASIDNLASEPHWEK